MPDTLPDVFPDAALEAAAGSTVTVRVAGVVELFAETLIQGTLDAALKATFRYREDSSSVCEGDAPWPGTEAKVSEAGDVTSVGWATTVRVTPTVMLRDPRFKITDPT